jgi:hypothetical protein
MQVLRAFQEPECAISNYLLFVACSIHSGFHFEPVSGGEPGEPGEGRSVRDLSAVEIGIGCGVKVERGESGERSDGSADSLFPRIRACRQDQSPELLGRGRPQRTS